MSIQREDDAAESRAKGDCATSTVKIGARSRKSEFGAGSALLRLRSRGPARREDPEGVDPGQRQSRKRVESDDVLTLLQRFERSAVQQSPFTVVPERGTRAERMDYIKRVKAELRIRSGQPRREDAQIGPDFQSPGARE